MQHLCLDVLQIISDLVKDWRIVLKLQTMNKKFKSLRLREYRILYDFFNLDYGSEYVNENKYMLINPKCKLKKVLMKHPFIEKLVIISNGMDEYFKITDDNFLLLKNQYLKTIILKNVNVEDESFKYLSNINNMNLVNCYISDEGLKYLTNLKKLSLANRDGFKISKKGIKYLFNIEELFLRNICLPENSLRKLKNIKKLTLYGFDGKIQIQYLGGTFQVGLIKWCADELQECETLEELNIFGINSQQIVYQLDYNTLCQFKNNKKLKNIGH